MCLCAAYQLCFFPLPYLGQEECLIGDKYAVGHGVEKSYSKALSYYRQAAEKGYARAMNALGDMYRLGQGIPRDARTALKWYRSGSDLGNMDACNSLGELYEHGMC